MCSIPRLAREPRHYVGLILNETNVGSVQALTLFRELLATLLNNVYAPTSIELRVMETSSSEIEV